MARLFWQVKRLLTWGALLLAFFGVDAAKRLPTPASILGNLPGVVAPAPAAPPALPAVAPPAVVPPAPVVPAGPVKHNISSCATGDGYDAAGHRVGVYAVCVVDGTQMNIGTWPNHDQAMAGIREFRRVHGK